MNISLQKAEAIGDNRVSLHYADGLSTVLDLTSILTGPIFEPLHDPNYFKLLAIESDTLRWPNGADIDPDVLRLWTENGRVLTPEETDGCFSVYESRGIDARQG